MVAYEFLVADRDSFTLEVKTVNGLFMRLVATQKSRRRRGGRTRYVYHRAGTEEVYWNRSRHGVLFIPMARTPQRMRDYYSAFVPAGAPGREARAWLDRNDYELVGEHGD